MLPRISMMSSRFIGLGVDGVRSVTGSGADVAPRLPAKGSKGFPRKKGSEHFRLESVHDFRSFFVEGVASILQGESESIHPHRGLAVAEEDDAKVKGSLWVEAVHLEPSVHIVLRG